MERFFWVLCGWKTFPADWNAWLQPDELLNMHLFFHPVWIAHDLVRLPKINWYSWIFPVSWSIFFYSSMKQMSYPILEFFQFPGMFSSILQWNSGPIRFFGRFSSVYQWNIKRIFSLDVYLITLTIHRWDSFASSTWFGFFSSWVLIWSTVFKL